MCATVLYGVDKCASGSYRGGHLVVERLLEDLLLPLLVQPEWLQGLQTQQRRRAQQAYPAVGAASAAAAARGAPLALLELLFAPLDPLLLLLPPAPAR